MKSLKHLSLSIPFLLMAALPAALADEPTEKMGETEYYPLKLNSVWHYKIGENKFTLKATKEEKVDGKPSVRVEMIGEGDKPITFENIQVTKDGVYRLGFEGINANPPVKFMELPPKAGAKWEVKSTIGKETLKGTFKMGEEKVKVPAGDFDTFYTESDDLDANGMKTSFKQYFAKGVGMVKQVIKINNQEIVIELEKYEPAK
jgi:hypothetical protein